MAEMEPYPNEEGQPSPKWGSWSALACHSIACRHVGIDGRHAVQNIVENKKWRSDLALSVINNIEQTNTNKTASYI